MSAEPSRVTAGVAGAGETTALRTHSVGSLSEALVGTSVKIAGWVHRRRDLGNLLFIDLRDRSGLAQLSFGPDWTHGEALERARSIGPEDVILVEGTVFARPEANPDLATGAVELRVDGVEVLSVARTPEIPVYRAPAEDPPSEKLRLRHRVLDLRQPEIQRTLSLRHAMVLSARNHLDSLGFLEVETPILTRATPEGARDYLVPSRVHPGEFYALPQSPQLYKQMLMVSGFDRYFQIARCFRDEDLRADRQPEFTQIDIEASFVEAEDILRWVEGMMADVAAAVGIDAPLPFPRMTWAESMERYGSDRPDLRFGLEIRDHSLALRAVSMNFVREAVARGERARGIRVPGGARFSRRQIGLLEGAAKSQGAPGLLWAKWDGEAGTGPLGKFLTGSEAGAMGLRDGDLALVAIGDDSLTSPVLDAVRNQAASVAELPRLTEHAWLWVTDFPMFEELGEGVTAAHHPFVMPHADDLGLMESSPLEVRGTAYDLVYNGTEFGSGSIRVHLPELQRRILKVMGMSDDDIDSRFGFLFEALGSGAPPHGGIALGVDRMVQSFTRSASLRDVIAFPKTTAARALLEGAPAPVPAADLVELGIAVRRRED